jgi:Multidrug resistance efflux pump
MLRQVHGNGTLVPEEIRWIPAANAGRIESILVLPGARVNADTVLLELSNPELDQAAFDAEWALKAAEAELANLKVTLESQRLNQVAAAATVASELNLAELDAVADEKLAKDGLVAELTAKRSRAKAEELRGRYEIEKKRLEIGSEAIAAQLSVQGAKVEQMRASLNLKKHQVDSLKVRAGIFGVLQRLGDALPLQVGQQVSLGANLARVADPSKLKAEIKIAETQAKDIQLDQVAQIDTRNGIIRGRVLRIDPASQNGTRSVDVKLEEALPKGAVPDLGVDGTIELERLDNVLYVERPVIATQPDSAVGLFKVAENGKTAVRVPVKLGRTSVSTVEVVEGLQVGDVIILSDMSQWDAYARVQLK